MNREEQDAILNELIKILASKTVSDKDNSPDFLLNVAYRLDDLYSSDYRHKYSMLFSTVNWIYKNKDYSLDYLAVNIVQLEQYVENKFHEDHEFEKSKLKIIKLIDHVNLEIARCTYNNKIEAIITRCLDNTDSILNLNKDGFEEIKKNKIVIDEIQKDIDTAKAKLEEAQCQLTITEQKLTEADKKIESSKTELIAILSIFAAIVLAVSGGITLLGGAFSALSNTPLLKTVLLSLICGFVLFNLIFGLIYIISKMIDRNIYAKCKISNCSCLSEEKHCNGLKKIRKRLPFVFWGNTTIIFFIIIDVALIILDNFYLFMPY